MLHTCLFTRLKPSKVRNYSGQKIRPKYIPFFFWPRFSNRLSYCCGRAVGRPAELCLVAEAQVAPAGWCMSLLLPTHSVWHAATASRVCWTKGVEDWLHIWVSPWADDQILTFHHALLEQFTLFRMPLDPKSSIQSLTFCYSNSILLRAARNDRETNWLGSFPTPFPKTPLDLTGVTFWIPGSSTSFS